MLEICRFVPSTFLEGIDLGAVGMDEFLTLLAKARYVEEVEAMVIQKGIANAFPDTG